MSRTKIAPMVHHAVEYAAYPFPGAENGKQARRELRALLAALRAAEHLVNEDRTREPGKIHCTWIEAAERTTRALARLRRVSGGAVKGNRKLPANSRRASPGGAEGGGR